MAVGVHTSVRLPCCSTQISQRMLALVHAVDSDCVLSADCGRSGVVYTATIYQKDVGMRLERAGPPVTMTPWRVDFWPVNQKVTRPSYSIDVQYKLDFKLPFEPQQRSAEDQQRSLGKNIFRAASARR